MDSAVPSALFSVLNQAFALNSSYWSDHKYATNSGFFSYLQPLNRGDNHHMARLASILVGLIRPHFPAIESAAVAEWWVQHKPHNAGHELHFDSVQGHSGVHTPLVSSVLYMSEGVGGCTLVTDQQLEASSCASCGQLVAPRKNRLLFFSGDLLHGVVPGSGVPTSEESGQRRITLMMAFWPKCPYTAHLGKRKRQRQQDGSCTESWEVGGSKQAAMSWQGGMHTPRSDVKGWRSLLLSDLDAGPCKEKKPNREPPVHRCASSAGGPEEGPAGVWLVKPLWVPLPMAPTKNEEEGEKEDALPPAPESYFHGVTPWREPRAAMAASTSR